MDYWGGQRVCWPPLSNYWGGLGPPGPPSSYAYAIDNLLFVTAYGTVSTGACDN